MDKDRVKGKMKDVEGRIERQVGEWTGDEKMQSEGAAKQVGGKVQNAFGKVKDAGRDAQDKIDRELNRDERDIKHKDRKRDAA